MERSRYSEDEHIAEARGFGSVQEMRAFFAANGFPGERRVSMSQPLPPAAPALSDDERYEREIAKALAAFERSEAFDAEHPGDAL